MNSKSFATKEFLLYGIPTMAVDLILHLLILKFENSVFYFWDPADLIMTRSRTVYFLIVSYLFVVAVFPIRFYKRGMRFRAIVSRAFIQTFCTLSLFALSVFALFGNFAGKFLLQEGILATLLISAWHLVFKLMIDFARSKGRNKVHVVIAGDSDNTRRLQETMQKWNDYQDYKVVAVLGEDLDAISEYLSCNKVHEFYCGISPALKPDLVNSIIRTCENLFIDFYYVPNMDGYLHRSMSFAEVGHVTVVKLREEPLANPVNAAVKRAFDIVISGLFLITVYPVVWLFVAVGTSISSPGPILFKQKRTGYKGKSFTMLKFRSMKVNADADKVQATLDDPRKTKFGNFLRKTSIDELPQMINVFRGDMSLIGPRPHMELHTDMYSKLVDEYLVRHMVKPGLTGWAQVNGCRGETRKVEQMADRVRHDIWYIEHWTLWLDIKIIFMTIVQIFKGDEQAY